MVNPSVGVTFGAIRVYYFESTARPSLIWIKLEKLDLREVSGVRKLTLVGKPDVGGDQTANLERSEPFKFLAQPANNP